MARPVKAMSPHLSIRSEFIDLMYFSGAKNLKLIESDVKKHFIFEKKSFSPYILNTIRRLPALGTTRDRVRGTMQGVNGAPEKRKLLRGLEPQRSYELFD